jgi:hypothetical protein
MRNSVKIPIDQTLEALCWAKDHCPTYITNDYSTDLGLIEFFFCDNPQGQQDMLMFQWKWS